MTARMTPLIMCHIIIMPSVNMRQLRDTRRLKAWLRSGKTVELRERDRPIARIVPARKSKLRLNGLILQPARRGFSATVFCRDPRS